MSSYGGGGRRGSSRGGRGRGRSVGGGGGGGVGVGVGGGGQHEPRLRPCSHFASGECTRGNQCTFAHVIKSHAVIDASTVDPVAQTRAARSGYHHHGGGRSGRSSGGSDRDLYHPVSAVSVWSTPNGSIKIFSGGHDGHWRLWNASRSFVKEFDHSMGGGKIETLDVASNYLFCGFEGTSRAVPAARVGMIHAWNLNLPADPPLEFHVGRLLPYAHNSCVSAFMSSSADGRIVSGSRDGTIRIWKFVDAAAAAPPATTAAVVAGKGGFVLEQTMAGHAGEVTGLVVAGGNILWSGGVDGTIRLWDMSTGECQYLISHDTPATPGAGAHALPPLPHPPNANSAADPSSQHTPQAAGAGAAGVGHSAAVTDLLLFESPHGNYVLTSSLDTTVKTWDASNGTCLHSESHGEGVTCMALTTDLKGNPLLLIGLASGAIMMRSILQTANAPAFCLVLKLSNKFLTCGHDESVRRIRTGPGNTFYSGGGDGRLCVWQITGDLGL